MPLRFAGQYHDTETGLYYNYNRYYNPDTGRYITTDPLGLTPSPNPHTYVTNPTTGIDPLALTSCGPHNDGDDTSAATPGVPIGPGSEKAQTVLDRVDAAGAPLPGYKGGSVFKNTEGKLPETPGVTYREWDVNPYTKGVNRGAERVVTGSDGSAYWTGDHYDTFLMFRGPTE